MSTISIFGNKASPRATRIFAALCFCVLCYVQSPGQCCTYHLSLRDSYGDGWNGASLSIAVNSLTIGSFSAELSGSNYSFEVCNGDQVELFYSAGEYENENSYQLYDVGWNPVFTNGPNPTVGTAFTFVGNCNVEPVPGLSPCNAIALDANGCLNADNSGLQTNGYNPGCAAYSGGEIWFSVVVPPSGNMVLATSGGGLNDTGLAVWRGNSCTELSAIACDDDAGQDYYSTLLVNGLEPGTVVYVEVFGYGGASGSFQVCATEIESVELESSELPLIFIDTQGQPIVSDNKIDAWMQVKYNGPGQLTYFDDPPNEYDGHIGIEVRGATSAYFPQKPFGIETRLEDGSNNNVSLLNMPEENDWILLSNYNDISFIRNILSYKLFAEMGHYSPRASLCEVVIDSVYQGVYVFCEKIKRDNNRVDIANLAAMDISGDELTGGYILQQNYWDANNSFQSQYSPIDHPGFDVHFLYEYPAAEVIGPSQKAYIAAYIDSLETALYSPDFIDAEEGYRKYLSVNSFIDYFLVNELSRNNDGFKKSVFFHKNKYSEGGKLKAGPVWDFDWAYKNMSTCSLFENEDGSGWAHLINDCPTDNYSTGWYIRLLQDSAFANQMRCRYETLREGILSTDYLFAYIDSVHTLVQHAQARHFQRWPILGLDGFSPEIGGLAHSYAEEIEKLKTWIALRMLWLDEHIPGQCLVTTTDAVHNDSSDLLAVYPNPSTGAVNFQGKLPGSLPFELHLSDATGRKILSQPISPGNFQQTILLEKTGVYSYTLRNENGVNYQGRIVVVR